MLDAQVCDMASIYDVSLKIIIYYYLDFQWIEKSDDRFFFLHLCSEGEWTSNGFGMTLMWINDDRLFGGVKYPFKIFQQD